MAVAMQQTTRKAFRHQKDGVKWLVSHRNRPFRGVRPKGAILADDMGLGKTFTAALAAKVHALDGCEAVVIAPKSLTGETGSWVREARAAGLPIRLYPWSQVPARRVVEKVKDAAGKEQEREYYVPLDTLPRKYVLIVDEAHNAQNIKAARTKAFLALAESPNCVAVYLLTGTPTKNGRPINLYPLLRAVGHPIARNRQAYEVRYCEGRLEEVWVKDARTGQTFCRTVWKNDGASNLQELHQLTQNVVLRRLKSECLDLPELLRTLITVEPDTDARRAYSERFNQLRTDYRRRLMKGEIDGTADAIVLLTHERRAASIAKAPTAIEMAEEVLEQGGQAIIFGDFLDEAGLRMIADHFGVRVYDGQTPVNVRNQIVDDFQAGRQKVFVGTGAGGEGVTLTAAQTVILLDRPWTPGAATQREARAHRIGQTGTVNAYWLQFGQVDEYVDNVLLEKHQNIEEILHGQRNALPVRSEGDFAKEVADRVFA